MEPLSTPVTAFNHHLVGDTVVNYSHDGRSFRELSMGIAPVRELGLAEAAIAFLTANDNEGEKKLDSNVGKNVRTMYRINDCLRAVSNQAVQCVPPASLLQLPSGQAGPVGLEAAAFAGIGEWHFLRMSLMADPANILSWAKLILLAHVPAECHNGFTHPVIWISKIVDRNAKSTNRRAKGTRGPIVPKIIAFIALKTFKNISICL